MGTSLLPQYRKWGKRSSIRTFTTVETWHRMKGETLFFNCLKVVLKDRFIFLAEPHELKQLIMSNQDIIIISILGDLIMCQALCWATSWSFLSFIGPEKYMLSRSGPGGSRWAGSRNSYVYPVKFNWIRFGQLAQAVVIFLWSIQSFTIIALFHLQVAWKFDHWATNTLIQVANKSMN